MNVVIKASVALVIVVMAISLLMYVTGIHENQIAGLVSVVLFIAANIGAVVWALKKSGDEAGYMRQLGNAAMIGLLGGVLIVIGSTAMLTTMPDYLEDMKDMQILGLERWNLPDDVMEAQVTKIQGATPVSSSWPSGIFTLITSLIVGAITAIWVRKKKA